MASISLSQFEHFFEKSILIPFFFKSTTLDSLQRVHDAGTIQLHYINATKSPAIYSSDLRELFLNLEDLEGERGGWSLSSFAALTTILWCIKKGKHFFYCDVT